VGLAATCHLAATTRMRLKHRDFGRLVAEWQQFLQNLKKLYDWTSPLFLSTMDYMDYTDDACG